MKVFIPCCLGLSHNDNHNEDHIYSAAEKLTAYTDALSPTELDNAAQETSIKLFHFITTTNSVNIPASNMQIQEIMTSGQPITISSSWWTKIVLDKFYKAMIELVTKFEELKEKLSPTMHKVIDEAERFAHEFAEFHNEHLILAVLIETTALAVLIEVLAPLLLEALGFGVEGVVEGKYTVTFVLSTRVLTHDV